MAMPEVTTYREAAHELLAQGWAELAAEDRRQASEKGWGAAAQVVKACAQLREWPHGAHWMLNQAVDYLVRETDDEELYDLFGAAQNLHTNFYEMWLSEPAVRNRLSRVDQFVLRVDGLLDE